MDTRCACESDEPPPAAIARNAVEPVRALARPDAAPVPVLASQRPESVRAMDLRRLAFCAFAVVLTLASCDLSPSVTPNPDEAARLRTVFPLLASTRVATYRILDWCKVLQYNRGAYVDTDSPTTCITFEGPVSGFDGTASRDFETIHAAFEAAGAVPKFLSAEFDPSGAIADAWFEMGCQGCSGGTYFYTAPGHTPLAPEGLFVQIAPEWRWAPE
jgi:hypothetical protein